MFAAMARKPDGRKSECMPSAAAPQDCDASASSRRTQPITEPWLGAQEARPRGVRFDLLSQTMHQLLEQLSIASRARAPYVHQDALGVDGARSMRSENLKQTILERRKTQRRLAAKPHAL
jgi:hypothetical protein